MTPACEAQPGRVYRLTRDPGGWYYRICDAATVRRLDKRLRGRDVRSMTPEDRFTFQALERCRTQEHVLGLRVLRYRDDEGEGRETKSYVAFPPEYMLREVERPPGYGPRRGQVKDDDSRPEQDTGAEVPVDSGARDVGAGADDG